MKAIVAVLCLPLGLALPACEKRIKPVPVSLGDTVSRRPSPLYEAEWLEDGRRWTEVHLSMDRRMISHARKKLNFSLVFTDCSGNEISSSEIRIGGEAIGLFGLSDAEFEALAEGLGDGPTKVTAYIDRQVLSDFTEVCGYLRAGSYVVPWRSPEFPIVFPSDVDFRKRTKRPKAVCPPGETFCATPTRAPDSSTHE